MADTISFHFFDTCFIEAPPFFSLRDRVTSIQHWHQSFLLLLPHLLYSSIARESSVRYDFRPQLWLPPYHVDSDSTPWHIGLFVTQEDPTARFTHEAVESSEHGWPMIL